MLKAKTTNKKILSSFVDMVAWQTVHRPWFQGHHAL
jgi:hypothetical protein